MEHPYKELFHKYLGEFCWNPAEFYDKAIKLLSKRGGLKKKKPSVSDSNMKLGEGVFSFSTMPVVTCNDCGHCARKHLCYDLRGCQRLKFMCEARLRNTWIMRNDPDQVVSSIVKAASNSQIFRLFVGGDVENLFQAKVLMTAMTANREVRWCRFWAYTKRYDVWNQVSKSDLPKNFSLLYSWDGNLDMDNPHGRRVAYIVKPGDKRENCPAQKTNNKVTCSQCRKCICGRGDIYFKLHGKKAEEGVTLC